MSRLAHESHELHFCYVEREKRSRVRVVMGFSVN